jgi:hypothetical protein
MADHEGPDPRDEQVPDVDPDAPGELFRPTAGIHAVDLAEALGGLDRATRNFARRLGERPDADLEPTPERDAALGSGSPQEGFDARMHEAEREARAYLDHAKRRADGLVNAMVGAVEQEAAEMRRDAEAGIRARWQQVEFDAERHLGEAQRIADSMVSERQQRISALSDGITGRADALTAGMDDADRVRAQFDLFVRALSRTADQIAGGGREIGSMRGAAGSRDDRDRPSAIAA